RKLDESLEVGYSCAGSVVEVSGAAVPYRIGERVACMGTGFAVHAEYVTVPVNLLAPVPAAVELDTAAFGAVACIALQGIWRLELTPGQTVGVIGLGLIGQIALQLLRALGYQVCGFDLDPGRAARAVEFAGVPAWGLRDRDCRQEVDALTRGQGLDGVLLCAATPSSEPANQAFD